MNSKSTSKVDSFKKKKNLGLGYFFKKFYVFIKLGYKDHYILSLTIKNTYIAYLFEPASFLLYMYFTLVHITKLDYKPTHILNK
jgi:hypothetical protein